MKLCGCGGYCTVLVLVVPVLLFFKEIIPKYIVPICQCPSSIATTYFKYSPSPNCSNNITNFCLHKSKDRMQCLDSNVPPICL